MRDFSNGVCTLDVYDQEGQFTVPRAEYAQLIEGGDAFLSWTGSYGQLMTVKGARVECIADWPALAWAEKEAEVADLKLKGEF